MNWMHSLYQTYNNHYQVNLSSTEEIPLLPVGHTLQQAQLEIMIDAEGNFLDACVVMKGKGSNTIIPATEKSAGRTSGDASHPLCDKLQYVAGDYKHFGGKKEAYFNSYVDQLRKWCTTSYGHPKAKSVLIYVEKRMVISDLVDKGILHLRDGRLATAWDGNGEEPPVFKLIQKNKDRVQDQGDLFVRWRVAVPGEPDSAVWDDIKLFEAWEAYNSYQQAHKGICHITGQNTMIAINHPARIRHGADKAKLISAPSNATVYTYKGRFTTPTEACSVGFEVTQKAHSALRWLIGRKQAFRNGDQVFIAWSISKGDVPNPFVNSFDLFGQGSNDDEDETIMGDAGQAFAIRLARRIAGYHTELGSTRDIVILGLDSASPGRLSIIFYRELTGSEFLDRINNWHTAMSWYQTFSKDVRFVGAPAPKEIAEAAYGRKLDEKLRKSTIEKLIPCIIDGQRIPPGLVDSVFRRACNRVALDPRDWEKTLGIACSLHRYSINHDPLDRRAFQMSLDTESKSRDYLYGRLLAAADGLEGFALSLERTSKKESARQTNAARFMHLFAERPCSTWRSICLNLQPYRAKLGNMAAKFDRTIQEVSSLFEHSDFVSDGPLTGEFLLGYYCQRQELLQKKVSEQNIEPETQN